MKFRKAASKHSAAKTTSFTMDDTAMDVEAAFGKPRLPSNIELEDAEESTSQDHAGSVEHSRKDSSSHRFQPSDKHHNNHNKRVFTAVILLLGAAASAAFWTIGIVTSRQEQEEHFKHEAQDLADAVQDAMQEYDLFGLWVHQACFKSATRRTNVDPNVDMAGYLGLCTRQEFADLYVNLRSRQDVKFQAVQFLPHIFHEERAALEREAQAYYHSHYPDFTYRGITDIQWNATLNDLVAMPRTPASFYWPVHYVEPLASNEAAVELDAYAVEVRATAIDKVVQTFQPSLSGGIRLVQETDPNARGIILRHPGVATSSVSPDKPRALTQIVIRVPDLLERATTELFAAHDKTIYLFDATSNAVDPDFLGGIHVGGHETQHNFLPTISLAQIPSQSSRGTLVYVETIPVADRQWVCAVIATDASNDSSSSSAILYCVLGGAIILGAAVLLALWFYTHMGRVAKWNELRAAAEEEKAKSAQRQVKRERQMNEFLSHEVRNPLSSAISALSFVSSTMNDPNECQFASTETRNTVQYDLRVMDASLQFINELLRNMLDVFRSANNQMKIELNPTDIRQDILEPVASILFLRGASSSAQVKVECPDDLACQADRMRLKQIILNLASNSAKFVKKGYVCLRAKSVNDSVEISVEDSGPGIPESKRRRMFAKFQQSLDELNQGTGVGLSVCKSLSDLMGADIHLDEAFDSGIQGCPGTRFVVRLNQPALSIEGSLSNSKNFIPDKSQLVSTSTPSQKSCESTITRLPDTLSVLFVDDDTVLRRMFTRGLKRTCPGWQISEASNGETALRLTDTHTFDIIFMDQYMASIEKQLLGTETVRALRSRGVESLICGLSANDLEQQFKEAGANYFHFKPFPCEKEALTAELIRILGERHCSFDKSSKVLEDEDAKTD